MSDAESEAAKVLSRARWGTARTVRLVDELETRTADIDEDLAARLRALVDEREGER